MNYLNPLKKHFRRAFVLFALAALLTSGLAGRSSWSPVIVAAQESASNAEATAATVSQGKIAFESNRDGNINIYVMNADGSVQVRLTNNGAENRIPVWSPDGTRIAFATRSPGVAADVYVMNADGSNVQRLTDNPADDFAFDWSPDGTRLVFISRRNGNSEIYTMNADGSNQTRLTNTPLDEFAPNWSPDGARLVFYRPIAPGANQAEIYTINIDGTGETNITNSPGAYFKATWSPDGTKILFWSLVNGNNDIFVINADGSNRVNLSNSPRDDLYPSWSPDGTKILFSSNRDNNFQFSNGEIYVMNADGSNQRRLTNHPANEFDSNWQPLTVAAPVFPNPIDDVRFFVTQHYNDFLNREPDDAGLSFWMNNINSCGSNVGCTEVKRIDTSAAFFLSIEFQETGYLAYRFYKAAYTATPARPRGFPRYAEFLLDMQLLGHNVRVNVGNWQAQLEANKIEYARQFVETDAFRALYPQSMTAAQYVDALNANTGGALDAAERDALVTRLNNQMETRATVLRKVAEDQDFYTQEFNRAFVLMQYFGYLRRNPYDPPEPTLDFTGYDFWLDKLNEFGGDYRRAEMVKAFITSTEYRQRFGQP
ncbi:MAG TPA: DUF4214 domain-containing protein [Pyrinomonadaceae bacterium]|jgi:TolB protein